MIKSNDMMSVEDVENILSCEKIGVIPEDTGIITSTNRGEPIVNTPENAYKCFMYTDLDVLVLENFVLLKDEQSNIEGKEDYQKQFKLD